MLEARAVPEKNKRDWQKDGKNVKIRKNPCVQSHPAIGPLIRETSLFESFGRDFFFTRKIHFLS